MSNNYSVYYNIEGIGNQLGFRLLAFDKTAGSRVIYVDRCHTSSV
jgi:hypothetical protein